MWALIGTVSLPATNKHIGLDFPALRRNCFFRLHFHFHIIIIIIIIMTRVTFKVT